MDADAHAEKGPGDDATGLIKRARRGDRAAFDRLAVVRRDRIARLAWRLLAWIPHDVDDVVQEVLMEAWRTIDRLRDDDQFDAWLFGITANRCRTWRRTWFRRRRRDTVAASGRPAEARPADAPGASDASDASEAELGAAVRDAMRRLSPRDREVVVLRYVEDLAPESIARALGVSRGAVDVRLHRARTRLAELLRPPSGGPGP